MYRWERVVGGGIIAPRRSSSAHLHRPWRATWRATIGATAPDLPRMRAR
jgi:hypothetical protein